MAEIRIPIHIPELEVLMATVEEVKAQVDNLSEKLTLMQTRINEDVQALRDQIAKHDLDQAVLDEINSGLDTITQRVEAIDPDPTNPPPT